MDAAPEVDALPTPVDVGTGLTQVQVAERIAAAGVPATFMLLPGAKHGEYGPEGERVLEEALTWALAKAP